MSERVGETTRIYEIILLVMVKPSVQPTHERILHESKQVFGRIVLVKPVMTDKDSTTCLIANVGGAISVHAWYHDNLLC